ncbi:MAG TPA: WYL domain-containing protein [Anaerolineaceae bacterium]|nr:WYL domain-containing protein [Anaerolineaceae bacterium]
MRADRLLSILMLLQARGTMTARELAEQMEVSERTIYRDIEALSVAGVPVYAQRGPGGGCALIDSYRTNLTGLEAGELQALFMLSIPTPLNDLGVSQELKAALLKLSAALPESRRVDEGHAHRRIYLDWSGWGAAPQPVTLLPVVQAALWQDRRLCIRYLLQFFTPIERVVEPLGLVAKADRWHLVYGYTGQVRVHPVDALLAAHALDETFPRPADFDLERFWHGYCQRWAADRPRYRVRARITAALIPLLPHLLGKALLPSDDPLDAQAAGGWVELTLQFESLEAARERLMGLGQAVEVLEPQALRLSLCDFARQILKRYETSGHADPLQ